MVWFAEMIEDKRAEVEKAIAEHVPDLSRVHNNNNNNHSKATVDEEAATEHRGQDDSAVEPDDLEESLESMGRNEVVLGEDEDDDEPQPQLPEAADKENLSDEPKPPGTD